MHEKVPFQKERGQLLVESRDSTLRHRDSAWMRQTEARRQPDFFAAIDAVTAFLKRERVPRAIAFRCARRLRPRMCRHTYV